MVYELFCGFLALSLKLSKNPMSLTKYFAKIKYSKMF